MKVGEDASLLPSSVFQLLQTIAFGEGHQIVSALVPPTQWTLLSRLRGFLPGFEQYHILVLSGEAVMSSSRILISGFHRIRLLKKGHQIVVISSPLVLVVVLIHLGAFLPGFLRCQFSALSGEDTPRANVRVLTSAPWLVVTPCLPSLTVSSK